MKAYVLVEMDFPNGASLQELREAQDHCVQMPHSVRSKLISTDRNIDRIDAVVRLIDAEGL